MTHPPREKNTFWMMFARMLGKFLPPVGLFSTVGLLIAWGLTHYKLVGWEQAFFGYALIPVAAATVFCAGLAMFGLWWENQPARQPLFAEPEPHPNVADQQDQDQNKLPVL